jgi:hypothetical protein
MQFPTVEQFPLHGFARFQPNGHGQRQGKADIEPGLLAFGSDCLHSERIFCCHTAFLACIDGARSYSSSVPRNIIPFNVSLPVVLPTIHGNVDYQTFRDELLRMDQLLIVSGLEAQLIEADLQRWTASHVLVGRKAQQVRQLHSSRALRCNLARMLLKESLRTFSVHLADSPLLQHFFGISEVDRVKVPSKSTLERYDKWWTEEEVRNVLGNLLRLGAQEPIKLDLGEAIDLESYFLDTTCVPTNIHYPVDWVLLRDATRTLTKAMTLIRNKGLKHRMEAPEVFFTRINRLCIGMTQCSGEKNKRARKRIFRKIDRLVGTVRDHARRYRDLLDQNWKQTDWTRAEAEQVLGRIDHVLELLPQARRQARTRIISEKQVLNEEKVLSLYEPDTRVIVRNKAGAQVEFGNTLLLGENVQGFIFDWEFFRESAPADAKLLERSVDKFKAIFGQPPEQVGADRGFDSAANRKVLAEVKVYNGMCPRNPEILEKRMNSWKFKFLQRRRTQIEPRIAILKNEFLGKPMRSKGFEHRALTISWAVLAHNLWVMSRMPRATAALQAAA